MPKKSEDEIAIVLNQTISLFRFLVEKDSFEHFYNGHLAKRLLNSRSSSDDAERNVLAKFASEAGVAFAKNATGMLNDIKYSHDTHAEYRRYQESKGVSVMEKIHFPLSWVLIVRNPQKAPFNMEPIICGSNNWPVRAHVSLNCNSAEPVMLVDHSSATRNQGVICRQSSRRAFNRSKSSTIRSITVVS